MLGAVRSGPRHRTYREMLKNEERLWVLAAGRPRKQRCVMGIGAGQGKKGHFPLWWQHSVNQRLFLHLNAALAAIPKEFTAAHGQSLRLPAEPRSSPAQQGSARGTARTGERAMLQLGREGDEGLILLPRTRPAPAAHAGSGGAAGNVSVRTLHTHCPCWG